MTSVDSPTSPLEIAPSPGRSRLRRRLFLLGKTTVVALVLVFIGRTIARSWDELSAHSFHVDPLWMAAAGLLYLAGLAPCAAFWLRTLHLLGQRVSVGQACRAYYLGHLGKYVPGKALVVIIRTGLLRPFGIGAGVAAVSVLYETLTMMAVGAFLAAAVLLTFFREHLAYALAAAALMLTALTPTLPPVFRRLVALARVGRDDPELQNRLRQLSGWTLLRGWLEIAVGWLLIALSLWAVLRGLAAPGAASDASGLLLQFPLYLAAVSLAMVAGFLSLVPGGALVREAILLGLLEPSFGAPAALAAAILLRLCWLGAELAVALPLYFWKGNPIAAAPPPATSPESEAPAAKQITPP